MEVVPEGNIMRARIIMVIAAIVAALTFNVVGIQSASASASLMASPCLDGRVAVDADFGPRFAWTMQGIRYPGNQQCSMIYQNRSLNGRMVLKIKMISNGVVTREKVRCSGCAAVSYGTGGYDRVKIRGKAFKRGSTVAFDTGWRRVA